MSEPYRKISVRIWSDEVFRMLSVDAKLVFLQLLTHPHLTSLGAMRANTAGLAVELGFDLPRFESAFGEILASGIALYDPDACLIALPKFFRHNPPGSPNVVRSWEKLLHQLPECEILDRQVLRAAAYCMERGDAWGDAFREALGKPFRKACERLPEAFRDTFPKGLPNLDLDLQLDLQHNGKNTSVPTEEADATAAGGLHHSGSSERGRSFARWRGGCGHLHSPEERRPMDSPARTPQGNPGGLSRHRRVGGVTAYQGLVCQQPHKTQDARRHAPVPPWLDRPRRGRSYETAAKQ